MRPAKLFAILAIFQLCLALVNGPPRPIDVYFHATYFVVGHTHLVGLMALTSVLFALVYFAASRWVSHPLSNSLGLIHFVFALAGFLFMSSAFTIGSAMASRFRAEAVFTHWLLLVFLAGSFCFLLGCATLATNCVWTAISVFRTKENKASA